MPRLFAQQPASLQGWHWCLQDKPNALSISFCSLSTSGISIQDRNQAVSLEAWHLVWKYKSLLSVLVLHLPMNTPDKRYPSSQILSQIYKSCQWRNFFQANRWFTDPYIFTQLEAEAADEFFQHCYCEPHLYTCSGGVHHSNSDL